MNLPLYCYLPFESDVVIQRRGTYIGEPDPDKMEYYPTLLNRHALVMITLDAEGHVIIRAQFDTADTGMTHGWHGPFKLTDFELDPQSDETLQLDNWI